MDVHSRWRRSCVHPREPQSGDVDALHQIVDFDFDVDVDFGFGAKHTPR